MLENSPCRTAQLATLRLNERQMWAQLVEAAVQGKEKDERAHEEPGTTDTVITCKSAAPLPENQQSDTVRISAKLVTVPTPIVNRTPSSAWREADTQAKQLEGVDGTPISPSVLKRRDGTIFERTDGRDCHDGTAGPQGNHATTWIARQDGFPPLSEELFWRFLRPKGFITTKKKIVHGRDHASTTQSEPQ